MPESDQWNGDDELPQQNHGSVQEDAGQIVEENLSEGTGDKHELDDSQRPEEAEEKASAKSPKGATKGDKK